MANTLPPLRQVTPSQHLEQPRHVIQSDSDVETWKSTRSYQDYALFLRRLNESVVGCYFPWAGTTASEAIKKTLAILDTLDQWISEIPPLNTPQRFGNLAFRTWGKRLEENVDQLLTDMLPPHLQPVIPCVKPYILSSFGSFTRMDYGTGHETSFALFLLCLTLTRFYQPVIEEEREIVLQVFLRYTQLCWRLQDTYKLEPAGSHGVWGLDDYSFLGYIFGSGQLRDQTEIPVAAVLSSALPQTNFYFMCIRRIHQVKHGPFHEHSSQLHSIAVGVPNWAKVNSGLFKMYEAEVLGKRVVVQHIPLGGLLEWRNDKDSASVMPSSSQAGSNTQAPWANSLPPLVPRYGRPSHLSFTSIPTSSTRAHLTTDIPESLPDHQLRNTAAKHARYQSNTRKEPPS
ncbi:hypothetical protein AX16_010105 [Volvariella volvacea WC 439]|nr:hypothetical protein AX16_010105 [Volvariella volvacea WC 439]